MQQPQLLGRVNGAQLCSPNRAIPGRAATTHNRRPAMRPGHPGRRPLATIVELWFGRLRRADAVSRTGCEGPILTSHPSRCRAFQRIQASSIGPADRLPSGYCPTDDCSVLTRDNVVVRRRLQEGKAMSCLVHTGRTSAGALRAGQADMSSFGIGLSATHRR